MCINSIHKWLPYVNFSADILADIIIALYMVLSLRQKQDSEFVAPRQVSLWPTGIYYSSCNGSVHSTSNVLNTLIMYSVSTGILSLSVSLFNILLIDNNLMYRVIYSICLILVSDFIRQRGKSWHLKPLVWYNAVQLHLAQRLCEHSRRWFSGCSARSRISKKWPCLHSLRQFRLVGT